MAVNLQHVILVVCLAVVGLAAAVPQNYTSPDQNATYSGEAQNQRQSRADATFNSIGRILTPQNIAQFKSLFTGLTNSYGASSLSNVLTFNVGNLIILTLLAGTALLIAPTLLSLFGITTGTALGRSLAGFYNPMQQQGNATQYMSVNVYRYIDDFFRGYNIDAATCMERFACTAARKSANAVRQGNPSYVDNLLNYVLSSSYMNSTLGQTKFMEAVEFGKENGSCEIEFGKCPFSWERVAQYLPFSLLSYGFAASAPSSTPTPAPNRPPANENNNIVNNNYNE